MSGRNADIVHRFWKLAVVERDFDAAMRLVQADGEFDWSNSRAPYVGVYRGEAAVKDAWRTWLDAWGEWHPRITESIEVDPETVVVVTEVHARGKESGVPVRAEGASVWRIRDGKIARAKLFQSKAEALAALSRRAT